MKSLFRGGLLSLMLTVMAINVPVMAAELAIGRDYVPIVPVQQTDNPSKVEVLEFFSYGCPHCNDFHPIVGKWSGALPSDVVFKRVPVSFGRPQWANLAKLYYALEATGDLARLDGAVFNALHKGGGRLYDDQSIIDWVAAQGVDKKKFTDAYTSFGVTSKAKRADQMAQTHKITGVPAMTVDGKYLVTGKELAGLQELPGLTDRVIDKVRGERKKK
ncbi:MAG TPA: thiol:disulfide interchange protein DsbA/DsbL [Accumulibacter sp.]|nr:thiol:disulfide interchange protein DsbA/DsbL [Accumulibacter sp.]HMW18318.1 thiol:disulfide interchange protein DsbA/DsbL [Accumulibacter sp.]HMX23663.1 thiol:disulfide interchange protein DsbA/DsbL [Accumulibacter sp.]HMY07866.1 thiol:disulfide interchange protein DsbA/DsbL [Accumulibacter sp.]HNC18382.1 thiol:disulfide interchange protein DsbA/DsbL [Accumulibacter sp.]